MHRRREHRLPDNKSKTMEQEEGAWSGFLRLQTNAKSISTTRLKALRGIIKSFRGREGGKKLLTLFTVAFATQRDACTFPRATEGIEGFLAGASGLRYSVRASSFCAAAR